MKKLATTVGLLTAMILLFNACKDSPSDPGTDPDPGNTPPATLEAVISYTPQTAGLGDEITLDASGSKDDQNIGYEIEWTLESKPSGSSATISSSTQSDATFTPDISGDYVVSLKITNSSEGISDDAQETISIANPEKTFVELSGAINSDMTLSNIFDDPAKKDYLVTGDLGVNAKLTVEPGVVIHLEEDILVAVSQDGLLSAQGTAQDSIIFTTANKAGGLRWKGLLIQSSSAQNSLKFVNISYAGNSTMGFEGTDYKAAVGIYTGGKVSIEDSHIHHNDGYGVYADDGGGMLSVFAGNQLNNNTLAGVSAPANTISSITGDNQFIDNQHAVEVTSSTFDKTTGTWNTLADGVAYFVSGNLTIDGALTLEAGTRFEMAENVLWTVNGALTANGTSSEKITFTTANKTGGLYWKGIYIPSADSRNVFNYAVLSYGGNTAMGVEGTNYAALIGLDSQGKVSVTNSAISHSKGYGLYVDNSGGEVEDFANNSFSDNVRAVGLPADEADEMDSNTTFSNNTEAEVEIFATTYSDLKATSWKPLNGNASYRVTGNLTVNGELTIDPGAKFEMDEDVLIVINGAFMAKGTSSDYIIFTTSNLAGGIHWKGLFIESSDNRNILDFARVTYAGNSEHGFEGTNFKANVGINTNGYLKITNSDISNSDAYGIYSKGTTNDFQAGSANNAFSNNPSGNAINVIS